MKRSSSDPGAGQKKADALLRLLLLLFPKEFRAEFGEEWMEVARAQARNPDRRKGRLSGFKSSITLLMDTAKALPLVWHQHQLESRHSERGRLSMWDALRIDLLFALRTLRKNPGFSAAALLTLALGIGATTTVFSVVDGVLLEPLPYPEPDHLAALWMTREDEGDREVPWSVPRLREAAAESDAFQGVSGYSWEDLTLTGIGDPEMVYAVSVTNGLLTTLGVSPAQGRDIRPEESFPGAPLVAVISHSFWEERLGSDPEVLGQTLELSGRAYQIVGVAPPEFAFPRRASLWIPGQWSEPEYSRDRHFLRAVGMMRPGTSLEAAQDEMNAVVVGMKENDPGWNPEMGIFLQSLEEFTVGDVRLGLLVLLGAVGMVLLIACANVANLLLARGATRAGEMAVRSTLGAGRRVLVRQLMTESIVLAAAGGSLGLLFSLWGIQGLKALSPNGIPRLDNIGLDGTVLTFTAATSLVVALAFGLAPAIRLSRTSIATVIRAGREGGIPGRSREVARSGLLVAEVSLSLALLLGAGLLLKSFTRINRVELGFEPEMVQQFALSLPEAGYDDAGAVEFFRSLEERLASLPGVEAAGMGSGSPLGRSHTTISFIIHGRPAPTAGNEPVALIRIATPGYLSALGIPLLRGRDIQGSDLTDSPRVALISATTGERFWPGDDPIGRQLSFDPDEPVWTIVGVVGDVRSFDITTETSPEIYFPHTQWIRHTMTMEVLQAGQVTGMETALRSAVRGLDPNLAVYNMEALGDRVDSSISSERFYLLMVGMAAGLAVILATVGLFGVVAFLVSRRTREIGIRIALGAKGEDVVGLVLRQSMPPVVLGVFLGLGIALLGGRVLSSLLYQVEPWDPQTFLAGALLFLAVAFGATLVPARWAARIPPTEAMRTE